MRSTKGEHGCTGNSQHYALRDNSHWRVKIASLSAYGTTCSQESMNTFLVVNAKILLSIGGENTEKEKKNEDNDHSGIRTHDF